MSEKLIPKKPDEVMVIRDLLPGVVTLSVPFSRFGMIKIGGRATIAKMSNGNLAVFSPVALTPVVQSKLQAMGGKVAYLIAPDIEHHIFLSPWSAAFPEVHVIAPEGLQEKRIELSRSDAAITDVPISTIFKKSDKASTHISEDFDRDFDFEYVDAHPNRELVFFHKPSKTLIQADLFFSLPATEQYSKTNEDAESGIMTKMMIGMQNTKGTAIGQKRMLWYGMSRGDRTGFNDSVKRINAWGFENVVSCHGDSILGDGKEIFEKVFEWHLAGQK